MKTFNLENMYKACQSVSKSERQATQKMVMRVFNDERKDNSWYKLSSAWAFVKSYLNKEEPAINMNGMNLSYESVYPGVSYGGRYVGD